MIRYNITYHTVVYPGVMQVSILYRYVGIPIASNSIHRTCVLNNALILHWCQKWDIYTLKGAVISRMTEAGEQLRGLLEWKDSFEQRQPQQPSVTVVTGNYAISRAQTEKRQKSGLMKQDASPITRQHVKQQSFYCGTWGGGSARSELRYRPRADQEDASRIMAVLQETFGESQSATQITKRIYECHQGPRQSLRDYSYK